MAKTIENIENEIRSLSADDRMHLMRLLKLLRIMKMRSPDLAMVSLLR